MSCERSGGIGRRDRATQRIRQIVLNTSARSGEDLIETTGQQIRCGSAPGQFLRDVVAVLQEICGCAANRLAHASSYCVILERLGAKTLLPRQGLARELYKRVRVMRSVSKCNMGEVLQGQ